MYHLKAYLHKIKLILLVLVATTSGTFAQKVLSKKKDYLVTITTDYGAMKLVLSDKTPLHRANFLKLTESKFYDDLLFHRVIREFMIQGGDPTSKNATPGQILGGGSAGERIPAEFEKSLYHRKGALAAARDNNPQKASSSSQFYIVHGRKWDVNGLKQQEARMVRKLSERQKMVYQSEGGSPHLDGNYTVFGQVIDGLEVLDKIANVSTDNRSRPATDVKMKVKAEVWKKKKITKKFKYQYE